MVITVLAIYNSRFPRGNRIRYKRTATSSAGIQYTLQKKQLQKRISSTGTITGTCLLQLEQYEQETTSKLGLKNSIWLWASMLTHRQIWQELMTHSEFIRTKKCYIISFITAGQHSASVADPGYLSRIRTFKFYPLRIPDPGSRRPIPTTATKEEGEKKLCVYLFLYPQKNCFIFE